MKWHSLDTQFFTEKFYDFRSKQFIRLKRFCSVMQCRERECFPRSTRARLAFSTSITLRRFLYPGLTSQLGWRLQETWWNGLILGFPEDARHTPYSFWGQTTTQYTFLSTYGPKEWFKLNHSTNWKSVGVSFTARRHALPPIEFGLSS
jgi:hypothetical protein